MREVYGDIQTSRSRLILRVKCELGSGGAVGTLSVDQQAVCQPANIGCQAFWLVV